MFNLFVAPATISLYYHSIFHCLHFDWLRETDHKLPANNFLINIKVSNALFLQDKTKPTHAFHNIFTVTSPKVGPHLIKFTSFFRACRLSNERLRIAILGF